MSRNSIRHALARTRGALSGTKRTTALLAGLAAIAATSAAMVLPASPASALSVHAIYLKAYPQLAVGAPNKLMSGSAAQLKECNTGAPGLCANDDNMKLSQQFIIPPPFDSSGVLLILNQQGLCLTNRAVGGSVTFGTCGNGGTGYASQHWIPALGGTSTTLSAASIGFTLQNDKSGGYLSPAATVPANHTPLTTSGGRWTWGISH